MAVYTTRTLGAYMQKKGSSMSWNFSSADPEFGALQAREPAVPAYAIDLHVIN